MCCHDCCRIDEIQGGNSKIHPTEPGDWMQKQVLLRLLWKPFPFRNLHFGISELCFYQNSHFGFRAGQLSSALAGRAVGHGRGSEVKNVTATLIICCSCFSFKGRTWIWGINEQTSWHLCVSDWHMFLQQKQVSSGQNLFWWVAVL